MSHKEGEVAARGGSGGDDAAADKLATWQRHDEARNALAYRMDRLGMFPEKGIFAYAGAVALILWLADAYIWLWLLAGYGLCIVLPNVFAGLAVSKLDERYAEHAKQMRDAIGWIFENHPAYVKDGFVLWLRPFYTDLSVGYINEAKHPSWVNNLLPYQFWSVNMLYDINDCIDYTLELFAPVVALGEQDYSPEDQLIYYLQTSDENWQAHASRLIDNALAILILPDATSGTLWEMNQIRSTGRLSRTVFLMPGENRFAVDDTAEGGRAPFDPGAEWDIARSALGEHGVCLPAYDPGGCFFTMVEEAGEVRVRESYPMGGEARTLQDMRRGFSKLLVVLDEILAAEEPAEQL